MSFAADLISHDLAIELSNNSLDYLKSKNIFLNLGEEAIAFQAKSEAGEELEKLFDECHKIKEKDFDQAEMNIEDINYKIQKIIEPGIKSILLKHFNIDIRRFHTNTNKYPDCSTGVNFYIIDIDAVCIGMDKISGTRWDAAGEGQNVPKKYVNRLAELINISKQLDLDTGKLKNLKYPIEFYLDIPLFFFAEQFMRVDKGYPAEEITAREFAAVIMHEVGHVITFIEHLAYDFYFHKQYDNAINGFIKSKPDFEDIHELCDKVILPMTKNAEKTINQVTNKKLKNAILEMSPIISKSCDKIMGFCDLIYNAKTGRNDSIKCEDKEVSNLKVSDIKYPGSENNFEFACTFVTKICELFIKIINAFASIFSPLKTIMGLLADDLVPLSENKAGDLIGTAHNMYTIELWADEFAVRQGYGGDQASALEKMRRIFFDEMPTTNIAIRSSKILQSIIDTIYSFTKFKYRSIIYNLYEDDIQRCRRLVQSNIGIFKNKNLSNEIREHYTKQLKISLNILDKYHKDYYNRDEYNKLKNILLTLITPAEWVRAFTTRTVSQQYEAHLNQLENLSNNLIYFNSSQLKAIADSMK